jgi:hypothetical protein
MKRTILAVTALALILTATAGADSRTPTPAAEQPLHRELLARGVVLRVAPISVRASSGSIVTCQVRNRALVADLSVGDHVKLKCVGVDGVWLLRRLVIHPVTPSREPAAERQAERQAERPAVAREHPSRPAG